uniref:Uncharacterized protein n=1 Tax=Pseudonaja textilis TaxID=8673 RepID=A0A670ZQV1_PSETE
MTERGIVQSPFITSPSSQAQPSLGLRTAYRVGPAWPHGSLTTNQNTSSTEGIKQLHSQHLSPSFLNQGMCSCPPLDYLPSSHHVSSVFIPHLAPEPRRRFLPTEPGEAQKGGSPSWVRNEPTCQPSR